MRKSISICRRILGLVAVVTLFCLGGCTGEEKSLEVSLEKRAPLEGVVEPAPGPTLTIAIGSMITPKEGYIYYSRLLEYLSKKIGIPVQAVDRESYSETNALLEAGQVDAAFVCGGPYVEGREAFGLELLVVPEVDGRTVYYSYLIVPSDSPAGGYEDLRGKTFAFTDPKSNSGLIVPTFLLAKMGEKPDTFFESYIYTYGHDRSIRAVAEKMVDGAAVDSLIYEYLSATDPVFTSKTKVIMKSEPYGIPPVVVGGGLNPEIRDKLKSEFLSAHLDEEGREILEGMMIDRFVLGDDSGYDSIRAMRRFIAGRPASR